MSVSTNNQPSTVDGGGGSGGEDDAVGGSRCKEMDDSEEEEGDNNKDFRKNKGKRVTCFRFRKVKSTLLRRKRKGVSGNSERRREGSGGGGGGCYLCLRRPLTSDSGGESQTSDPNSPNFTYEMLRVLIEKNDFYSNECNPHLDVESKPCSNQDDKDK
ncbi:uncharacterized protein LOC125877761 [Solanum stenotomum]|uniref:uncharacterized protein LOC125877761 n=1 Tax=Solanum stenotomum TaxID=172797 RepID=UPI0020D03B76|nr:uncharacterized protein LOC125877761 [Solanum stenotomum]